MGRITKQRVSNLLAIFVSIVWIYMGFTKFWAEDWVNITLPIIAIVMIVLNLWIFQDSFKRN